MPETIAPAAPAAKPAPAPAPSPTPTAPPTPAPAPTPEPSKETADFSKAFDDAMIKEGFSSKPSDKKPDAAPEPAKPAAVAPKPGDKPTPALAPAAPQAPKQLREQLEKVNLELSESRKTSTALEAKVKEYEAKGKDTDGLLAQLDTERKEREKIQAELRMLKQEASPEFKEKWDKPFNQQAEYAQGVVNNITKQDGTPFSWENDFAALYRLPYPQARAMAIESLGPENAQIVMDEVRDLKKLDFARGKALEQEKSQWAEREKADQAKSAETKVRDAKQKEQQKQDFDKLWKQVNTDFESSVETYRVAPDDKELTEAKVEGLHAFDTDLSKDFKANIARNAHMRLRAGMFKANQLTISRQMAEIEKLKAKIAELDPAQPGLGSKAGGAPAPSNESWEDAARKALKGA